MRSTRPWTRYRALILTIVCAIALGVTGMTSDKTRTTDAKISELSWLEGKWRGTLGENTFEATYSSPAGGEILSINKEFLPDGSVFVEFERFRMVDSFVVMTPYPGGKESVPFTMVSFSAEDRMAKFSNPEHDFPNDIIYYAVHPDSLEIDVSGLDDSGQRKGFTARLKKIR